MVEGEGPEGIQVLTSAKLENCCGDLWVSVVAVMITQHSAPRHVEHVVYSIYHNGYSDIT